VPNARVLHSHNYTARQVYRRQYGEARAEARIFAWSRWQRSFPRYIALPYVRQVLADVRHCARSGRLVAANSAPWLRMMGALGRWRGLRDGLREEPAHALRAARQS